MVRYLLGATAARIADEGARVSLVLLALSVTGRAALGGAMIAALLVPHVVAAPLIGLMIDRSRHPRRVIAAAVLVFAASLFATAHLIGHAPIGAVLGVLVLGGCAGPAITGGLTGQLPGLVGMDRAPRAFGLDSLFYNVAGPALAGVATAAVGVRAAQSLLAGSAALGAVCVATLPIRPHAPARGARRPNLLGGTRAILREPTLRLITAASAAGQLGPGALAVVAAVLATARHRPAAGGLLLTAVAAGAFAGSLLWTWHPLAPERSPMVVAVSMIGIGVPIAAAATSSSLVVTAVLFGLSGVFAGPFGSALFTARTRYATEAVRTQVFTIGAGLKVSASALGAGLIGLVAGIPVPAQLLLVAASPLLAGSAAALVLAGRRTRVSA